MSDPTEKAAEKEISQEDCRKYKAEYERHRNVNIAMLDQLRIASAKHNQCPISQKDLLALYQMMDLVIGRKQQINGHPHRRAEDKEGQD